MNKKEKRCRTDRKQYPATLPALFSCPSCCFAKHGFFQVSLVILVLCIFVSMHMHCPFQLGFLFCLLLKQQLLTSFFWSRFSWKANMTPDPLLMHEPWFPFNSGRVLDSPPLHWKRLWLMELSNTEVELAPSYLPVWFHFTSIVRLHWKDVQIHFSPWILKKH